MADRDMICHKVYEFLMSILNVLTMLYLYLFHLYSVALRSRPFIDIWRQNAVPRIIPDEEVPGFFHADDHPSSPFEREV
jgi:hypothetical protein